MMAIATLREHFGLSQSQLANILAVSTGYIKMAESGRRSLSPIVTEKFLALVALTKATGSAKKTTTKIIKHKASQQINAELNNYIITTSALVGRQKKALAKMEKEYQQAQNRQFLLEQEQKKSAQDHTPEKWLQLLTEKTAVQLENSGETARAMLKLQVDINQFGLEQASRLMQQQKANKNKRL